MAIARSQVFKSPMCRLSFAQSLFKPRAQEKGKPPKYGCTLIFPKSDRAELEKVLLEVIKAEWGDKGVGMAKSVNIKSPLLAGDGKEAHHKTTGELHPGLGPDVFFIRPTANEDRPPLVRWKDPNTQETERTVYSGCYGKAVLNAYAWIHPSSGNGVSFGIQSFQKWKDGERLGGEAVDPEKWMDTFDDEMADSGDGAAALFGG